MYVFWPNDEEVKESELTTAQWNTIDRLYKKHKLPDNVIISPSFGGINDKCVMLDAWGLIIGIEQDGYAHT